MSSTLKNNITYWPMAGRVGPAIMALDYVKIPYERTDVSFATWGADSQDLARFPLGAIPTICNRPSPDIYLLLKTIPHTHTINSIKTIDFPLIVNPLFLFFMMGITITT